MKIYTLDYSKWRAGGASCLFSAIGTGPTQMLNAQGFMCCLGQFAIQDGFSKEEILNKNSPAFLKKSYKFFIEDATPEFGFSNNSLSEALMTLNDDPLTTWRQKIFEMHALLKEHGIKLIVINTPEPINLID